MPQWIEFAPPNSSPETTKDILIRAREIFRERGGAIYKYMDSSGRVCALGALGIALGATREYEAEAIIKYNSNEMAALSRATLAMTKGSLDLIHIVNDQCGPSAVLDIYDYAIKELENEA